MSLIDHKTDIVEFKVSKYTLSFPAIIKFETFNDPNNYYGIIFFHGKYKYEVLNCKLGPRFIIKGQEGECRDMPFNMQTAPMLPDFVKVKIL